MSVTVGCGVSVLGPSSSTTSNPRRVSSRFKRATSFVCAPSGTHLPPFSLRHPECTSTAAPRRNLYKSDICAKQAHARWAAPLDEVHTVFPLHRWRGVTFLLLRGDETVADFPTFRRAPI
eukprot:1570392-Prymnesium_polylepis.2